MGVTKSFHRIILSIFLIFAFGFGLFYALKPNSSSSPTQESYWVVDMSTNKNIAHTSIPLSIGDEYITADNTLYRIVKLIKDKAYVKKVGTLE